VQLRSVALATAAALSYCRDQMMLLRLGLCALLWWNVPAALQAQLLYSVVDLDTLGGTSSAGNAVNSNGQVTGAADLVDDDAQNAFLSGVDGAQPLQGLGTLGGSESFGQAIDATGRVAGTSKVEGDVAFRAFLSAPNGGALANLGTLGGGNSYGLAVNGSGQVAGYSLLTGNSVTHAFLSAPDGGALKDLGTLTGGPNSFAYAVNASGQVAGYSSTVSGFNHAFMSEANGGALRDLGTLGGRFSFGFAINDAGQVAGRSELSTIGQHAFRSFPNGGPLLNLGTLGGSSSSARGINNSGTVVGESLLGDNSTQHAFLYTTETGMLDLNAHLPAGSGWVLTEARAINDRGQITGVGMFGGRTRGFLLTRFPSVLRITSITRLTNGHVLIKGVGTPSQTYAVQATSDVRTAFVQLATMMAANDGELQFEDAEAAIFSKRFYRFVAP
jgi:probable HAF family extracellular repeat protein